MMAGAAGMAAAAANPQAVRRELGGVAGEQGHVEGQIQDSQAGWTKRRFMQWGSSSPSPPPPTPPPPPPPPPTPQERVLQWTVGVEYSPILANLGDSLVFEYDSAHDVYELFP